MLDFDFYFNCVSASVTGCTEGIYINPCNNETHIDPRKATNAEKVNLDGVNHVCIDRAADGNFYIFQASGYTPDRGAFLDMY